MKIQFVIKALIFSIGFILFHGVINAHQVEQPKDLPGIGIDEKLGQVIPLDLTFYDENGNPVSLKQLIHTPIILAPVFLKTPSMKSRSLDPIP